MPTAGATGPRVDPGNFRTGEVVGRSKLAMTADYDHVWNGDVVVETVSLSGVARLVNSKGEVFRLHTDYLARLGATVPGGSLPGSAALASLRTLPKIGEAVTLTEDSASMFRGYDTGRFFEGQLVRMVALRGESAEVERADGNRNELNIDHLKRISLGAALSQSAVGELAAMLAPERVGGTVGLNPEAGLVQVGSVTLKMRSPHS